MITKKCLKCDYTWESVKDFPKECPACKSRYWNVPKKASSTLMEGGKNVECRDKI